MIREKYPLVPIIFFSSKKEEEDIIAALEMGPVALLFYKHSIVFESFELDSTKQSPEP
jgi:DNA-binding NarL/FixJ family response regulator